MKNIQTYVYSKRGYGDPNRLNLDWNEADQNVALTQNEAINLLSATKINLYGDFISESLARLTLESYGVPNGMFLPVPGSDYGIEAILRIMMQPNDKVYIEKLGYKHFEIFAGNMGGEISKFTPLEIKRLKDEQAIIYIVNPNNPTGAGFDLAEIESLLMSNPNSLIIIDEAYIEFSQAFQSVCDWVSRFNNLIVLRTFSKAFGMAGVKFGYIFACERIISTIRAEINQKCLPAISLAMACKALENRHRVVEYVAEVNETKRILSSRFDWKIDTQTNFFTIMCRDRSQILSAQEKFNIGIRSLAETYGVSGAYRITLVGRKNRERLMAYLDYLVQADCINGVYQYEK